MNVFILSPILMLLTLLLGCNGTTTGNPITYPDGSVAITSSSYTNTISGFSKISPLAAVTDFKFCITKISLEDETGVKVNGGSLDLSLGLIDLSDSSTSVDWGTHQIPVGFNVSRINIELHQDVEICGVAYSLSYNNTPLEQDIEFTFNFSPAVPLQDGDHIDFNLSNIAASIEQAHQSGNLTNELINSYLESIQGEGNKL